MECVTMEGAMLDGVPVELIDIASACEVEISDHTEDSSTITIGTTTSGLITEDQQLLKDEIKEEEMEDADVSQEISQQGKRLLLKVRFLLLLLIGINLIYSFIAYN